MGVPLSGTSQEGEGQGEVGYPVLVLAGGGCG